MVIPNSFQINSAQLLCLFDCHITTMQMFTLSKSKLKISYHMLLNNLEAKTPKNFKCELLTYVFSCLFSELFSEITCFRRLLIVIRENYAGV